MENHDHDTSFNDNNKSTISDPSHNPKSLFYFHPKENLNDFLVSSPLDEYIYHNWIKFMQKAISFFDKLDFTNGSRPRPLIVDAKFEL